MPVLECDTCSREQDFPSTWTVVEEPVDGWELDVTENDNHLRVDSVYCPDCQ